MPLIVTVYAAPEPVTERPEVATVPLVATVKSVVSTPLTGTLKLTAYPTLLALVVAASSCVMELTAGVDIDNNLRVSRLSTTACTAKRRTLFHFCPLGEDVRELLARSIAYLPSAF